ncbi:MAG: putative toxin-antitoxin system toxin component, PIN family, partial [Candidatus Diapherotrites archaeon]|nr:putative toxin-antitoxin system toxin component, PIN family [Candidatus Diapherotrites archaeon]
MRATVDTNILISAAFWKGNEAEVIELTEKGKITLVLSKAILSEFEEVLRRKFGDMATETEILHVVEKFISISEIVEPNIRVNIVKEDSDDNRILECAIAGNAA